MLSPSPSAWSDIVFGYMCPSLGCIMSVLMFAAPVSDLRQALLDGQLGALNPVPWAVMTGNCLGWCAYGYYKHDPFILASNLPGLVLSIWLNMGAAKLQYFQLQESGKQQQADRDAVDPVDYADEENILVERSDDAFRTENRDNFVIVPQEAAVLRMLLAWSAVLVWVGWVHPSINKEDAAETIGWVVNVNLVFFYGAPLQTMSTVVSEKCSDSIHRPTMVMNWFNTTFWLLYGMVQRNPIIFFPNGVGLLLGMSQGILCLLYPKGDDDDARAAFDLVPPAEPTPLVARTNNAADETSRQPDAYVPQAEDPPAFVTDNKPEFV